MFLCKKFFDAVDEASGVAISVFAGLGCFCGMGDVFRSVASSCCVSFTGVWAMFVGVISEEC